MSGRPAMPLQFHPSTLVADALALHPKTRWVLAAYHIGGCSSCTNASRETLEEVARGYAIPLERLLGDLNALHEKALHDSSIPESVTATREPEESQIRTST